MEDLVSGATSDPIYLGYPPWKMHAYPADDPLLPDVPAEFEDGMSGMMADSFFDVYFDIRVPEAMGDGWSSFSIELVYLNSSPWTLENVTCLLPNVELVPPEVFVGPEWTYVYLNGDTIDMSEYTGEQTALCLTFSAEAVTDFKYGSIHVVPGTFGLWNSDGIQLFMDDDGWESFTELYLTVKPTKTLNMHIYRVEGSATDEEINADVQAAEDAFNLNALLCTLGYYVDFNVTITTIPLADWNDIDEDGDGLDRYDANGDGD